MRHRLRIPPSYSSRGVYRIIVRAGAVVLGLAGLGGVAPAVAAAAIQASFECEPACEVEPGTVVTFTSTSTSDSAVSVYSWDRDGDGLFGRDDEPDDPFGPDLTTIRRTFESAGEFSIGLRVNNDAGESSTIVNTVTVREPTPPPTPPPTSTPAPPPPDDTSGGDPAPPPPSSSGGSGAPCVPKQLVTPVEYWVRVCGMPDFDQRRIKVADVGAAQYDFGGLFAGGRCHCVPTSLTNILGYYAGKGLDIQPPPFDWNGRVFTDQNEPGFGGATAASYTTSGYSQSEKDSYEQVTLIDAVLGVSVKATADKCGTGFQAVASQMNMVMPAISKDASFAYSFNTDDAKIPRHVAVAMANGATVALSYGVRDVITETGDGLAIKSGPRLGGHVMALRAVKGGSKTAVVALRDPAHDEFAQSANTRRDRVRQSHFLTTYQQLRKVTGVFAGKVRTQWQLGDIVRRDDGPDRVRFLDGWIAVWPQVFVAVDGKGFSVSGQLLNSTGGPSDDSLPPKPILKIDKPVVDATYLPKTGEVAFVAKGSSKLQAINIATKQRRTLGKVPKGVIDLDTDAKRSAVLALGSKQLHRIPADASSKRVKKAVPGFDVLGYDPVNDKVAVVKSKNAKLRLLDGTALGTPRTRKLPKRFVAGKGRLMVTFDSKGRLLLRRAGAGTIHRADVVGPIDPKRPLRSHAIAKGAGLVAADDGSVLSIIGGRITPIDADGNPVQDHKYTTLRAKGRIVSVIRNSVDILPELAGQTVDQRMESAGFPELSLDGTTASGPGALPVMSDADADSALDSAPLSP